MQSHGAGYAIKPCKSIHTTFICVLPSKSILCGTAFLQQLHLQVFVGMSLSSLLISILSSSSSAGIDTFARSPFHCGFLDGLLPDEVQQRIGRTRHGLLAVLRVLLLGGAARMYDVHHEDAHHHGNKGGPQVVGNGHDAQAT